MLLVKGEKIRWRATLAVLRSLSDARVGRLLIVGLAACLGCDVMAPAQLPSPDHAMFRERAYPVLLRDCAFGECHGSPDRFFQVFGPGRTRLDASTESSDPPTATELTRSYERSRSMLVHTGDILMAPLLRKPVEGAGHKGLDRHGRNVYPNVFAPGFIELHAWASQPEVGQ